MSLLDIGEVNDPGSNDAVVRCRVCKAEMNQVAIGLKDRVVGIIMGASSVIIHYQCPECENELITINK